MLKLANPGLLIDLDKGVDAADPTMQVKLSSRGDWHRIQVDFAKKTDFHGRFQERSVPFTACGERLSSYYGTREETYLGDLCDECFTPFELEISKMLLAQEVERQRLELLREEDEATSRSRAIADSRVASRERLSAVMKPNGVGQHGDADSDPDTE